MQALAKTRQSGLSHFVDTLKRPFVREGRGGTAVPLFALGGSIDSGKESLPAAVRRWGRGEASTKDSLFSSLYVTLFAEKY